MKALKALVLGMGVLLVAGLGLLVYGVSTRMGNPPVTASRPTGGFGEVEIALPAGARVEQMAIAGERVVLRLSGGGPERVLVLDPASGRVSGSFALMPAPPSR